MKVYAHVYVRYVCVCACARVVEPAPRRQLEAQVWLVSDMKRAATHKRAPVHFRATDVYQSKKTQCPILAKLHHAIILLSTMLTPLVNTRQ